MAGQQLVQQIRMCMIMLRTAIEKKTGCFILRFGNALFAQSNETHLQQFPEDLGMLGGVHIALGVSLQKIQ